MSKPVTSPLYLVLFVLLGLFLMGNEESCLQKSVNFASQTTSSPSPSASASPTASPDDSLDDDDDILDDDDDTGDDDDDTTDDDDDDNDDSSPTPSPTTEPATIVSVLSQLSARKLDKESAETPEADQIGRIIEGLAACG